MIQSLSDLIGYEATMIMKNLTVFISGGIVFSILTFFLVAYANKNVSRDTKLDGAVLVRIKTNGKEVFKANPTTTWSFIYAYLLFICWKLCGRGTIIVESRRLIKMVAVCVVSVGMFIITLGIYLSLHIVVYDPHNDKIVPVSNVINTR